MIKKIKPIESNNLGQLWKYKLWSLVMSYTDKLSTGLKLSMIKEQHNNYRENKKVY